jgi:hypothetical protein
MPVPVPPTPHTAQGAHVVDGFSAPVRAVIP